MGAEIIEAGHDESIAYLERTRNLPALRGVTVETETIAGAPALTLLSVIAAKRADLVVMTSHGRTGLSRWVLGSVAQHIAHDSPVPVFVLRASGGLADTINDDRQSLPVLVPLDGSPLAEEALTPTAQLLAAITPHGELRLTLVVTPLQAITENMPDALVMEGAKVYLRERAERLEREWPDLRVTWSVGVGVDPAEAILREAQGTDGRRYGAIAMATHARSGMSHWAFGSVTERVLHGTTLPLLIVRPTQAIRSHDAERT
jgi:nucleotide-binding universal stress UspA family protein